MMLRLGPLPSEGALRWMEDTIQLLDALGDARLPFALPLEQRVALRELLEAMRSNALTTDVFEWETDTTLDDLRPILTYWLNIGRLSDQMLADAGGPVVVGRGRGVPRCRAQRRARSKSARRTQGTRKRLRVAWRPSTPTGSTRIGF